MRLLAAVLTASAYDTQDRRQVLPQLDWTRLFGVGCKLFVRPQVFSYQTPGNRRQRTRA